MNLPARAYDRQQFVNLIETRDENMVLDYLDYWLSD